MYLITYLDTHLLKYIILYSHLILLNVILIVN